MRNEPNFALVVKLQPFRQKLLHGRPRRLPWPSDFATRMLTRDLLVVANLLVELSSVKHASQNHQHNSISILLTAVE